LHSGCYFINHVWGIAKIRFNVLLEFQSGYVGSID
jgi:hypothetical protein